MNLSDVIFIVIIWIIHRQEHGFVVCVTFGSLSCCNVWCVLIPEHYNDGFWGNWQTCQLPWWSAFLSSHLQGNHHLAKYHLESVIFVERTCRPMKWGFKCLQWDCGTYGTVIVDVSWCHIYNNTVCTWLKGVPVISCLEGELLPWWK